MSITDKIKYEHFFNKAGYKVSRVEGVETRYFSEEKEDIIIEVENEELGRKCYPLLKDLKRRGLKQDSASLNTVYVKKIDFISKGKIVKKIILKALSYMDCSEIKKTYRGKIYLLRDAIAISNYISYLVGYSLNEFNPENFKSVVGFLAAFEKGSNPEYHIVRNNACIIKFIHYFLSAGGDFDSFYEEMDKKEGIYKAYEFPYAKSIVKLCNNYYKEKIFKGDIRESLNPDEETETQNDILYADVDTMRKRLEITYEDDKKVIFSEKYCIIKVDPNSKEIAEYIPNQENNELLEVAKNLLYNFDGMLIGFEKEAIESKEAKSDVIGICEKEFQSTAKICDFLMFLYRFLLYEIREDSNSNEQKFDIKKDLVLENGKVKFLSFNSFFRVKASTKAHIEQQIIELTLEYFVNYIKRKYGNITSFEEIMSKKELRYLNPVLIYEVVEILNNKPRSVIYHLQKYCILDFITRYCEDENYIYDKNFHMNPFSDKTNICFNFEAKHIYKHLELGKRYGTLPDGRTILLYDGKEDAKEFFNRISKNEGTLSELFNGPNCKMTTLDTIIYTSVISDDGFYKVSGVIVKDLKGEKLEDKIKNANNRELYWLLGNIYCRYAYKIVENGVYLDGSGGIYLNPYDEMCEVINLKSRYKDFKTFIESTVIKYMKYSYPNSLVGVEYPSYPDRFGLYFRSLAVEAEEWCIEHQIYYNPRYGCPICNKFKVYLTPDELKTMWLPFYKDKYASYYYFNGMCVKIYYKNIVDIKSLNRNITRILSMGTLESVLDEKKDFVEDAFIPKKLLYDGGRNEFIGYVYKMVSMQDSEECININDPQLPNAQRAKALIRLIEKFRQIISKQMAATINPFTDIFIVKDLEGVQILNIEFFKECDNHRIIAKNYEWIYDYIVATIKNDKNLNYFIDLEKIDKIEDGKPKLDSLYLELENVVNTNTKYCGIHNMFYNPSSVFCPICTGNHKIPIEHVDIKEIISRNTKIGRGGEAKVYSYQDESVIKIFNDEVDMDRKTAIIVRIISKKDIFDAESKKDVKYHYIIPEKIIETDNGFAYTMKKIKGNNISDLRDTNVIKEKGITRKEILEILITVGEGIETLHSKANITIGDLNGGNIVFDSKQNIYFIDFDGMGIDEYPPITYTTGYIDPVSEKNHQISMKDDWYSFAIQSFYYLTHAHPFSGIYEERNGERKRNMSLPDRMEKRISILGNHGVAIPEEVEPWDWMGEDLTNKFLEIFEGDDRTSILPELKEQYSKLYEPNADKSIPEVIRLNENIIAKEDKKFENALKIIDQDIAICLDQESHQYISIKRTEQDEIIYYSMPGEINEVLLDPNGKYAWIIYESMAIEFSLETNEEIVRYVPKEKILKAVVNENNLYLAIEGEPGITVIDSNGKEKTIIFDLDSRIETFFVKDNNKMVAVMKDKNRQDFASVYCNYKKFKTIPLEQTEDLRFNVLYDEMKNMWCVISSDGFGLAFDTHHTEKTFLTRHGIDVERVKMVSGKLYIPEDEFLFSLDIFDAEKDKKLKWNIIRQTSKLCDITVHGFSIIIGNKLYRVCEG